MVAFLREMPCHARSCLSRRRIVCTGTKDWVTIDDLGIEVHLVKEAVILSQDSRSSEKFMHGIRVLMAKNYIDNLSEEIKKGMLEKPSSQSIRPARLSVIKM